MRYAAAWALLLAVEPLAATATLVPFSAKSDFNTTAVDGARAVAWADIDRDGDFDVASAAVDSDDVEWWENAAGDGSSWTRHVIDAAFGANAGASLGAFSIALADLDGDGYVDVLGAASGSATGTLVVWINDGSPGDDAGGDGNSWTEEAIAAGALDVRSVAVADLDADGALDVIAGTIVGTTLSWWANDGGWTSLDISTGVGGALDLAASDLDGDGDLDVAATAFTGNELIWFENDGDPTDNTTELTTDNYWARHTVRASFGGAASLAAADMDLDGDPDLVATANTDGDLIWFENDGTPADDTGGGLGNSWSLHPVDLSVAGVGAVEIVDLDRDGDPDLLVSATGGPEITWYENADGSATSWTARTIADSEVTEPRAANALDIDGDGDPDIVAADQTADDISWWENLTIHRSALLPAEEQIASDLVIGQSLVAADLDRDGDLDLVGGSTPMWLENASGDGSVWTARDIDGGGASTASVAVGDLNRDGNLDVATVRSGDVEWHQNDGTPADGGWTKHTMPAATGAVSPIPTDVALADMDRDGDLDMVVSYLSLTADGGLITWWQNDGTPADGGWVQTDVDDTITDPRAIAVGDLDADGDPDIAGVSQNSGKVWWWKNTAGDGSAWSTELTVSALIGPSGLDLGDFDHDGSLDVASSDAFGNVTIHRNTAGDGGTWGLATVRTNQGENAAYRPIAADLDGDGDFDLMIANEIVDEASWLENDGTVSSWPEVSLSSSFDTARQAVAADLDRDGDLDVALIGGASVFGEVRLWLNRGGQFALATTDTAPTAIGSGSADEVLRIEAAHRGEPGETDVELASFELLLEESAADPLADSEADALFDGIDVYVDDGSGVFDVGDTLVASEGPPFSLSSGALSVPFLDGIALVQVQQGTPRTYFVVADLAAGAAGASPNSFRVTHLTEASSTAEDAAHDIPLLLEFASNVTSGTVTASGAACYLLTLGKAGSGAVPTADPTSSIGCAAGRYHAAESITLTAAPLHSGYVVLSWAGTDNNASTSLTNTVTMPAAPKAAGVGYGLADDLVLTADTYSSTDEREACNSITAGAAVVVQTGADMTYRAPTSVTLTDGFTVEDASFTVDLAVPAACP